jgi:diguanylate cyclase (GGDEF)-like protein/PAS domain S-box-containing protein
MPNLTEYDFINEAVVEGELQLFRTLWYTSDDNLFIVKRDENGDYISEKCNRSLELTFNLTAGQVDGVALCEILDETTYKGIKSRYDMCIEKNKPINYEEAYVLDDEGERFYNTTIVPSFCKDSDTVRIIGISREITDIRRIEKKLKESNDRLEAQVQERTKELTRALEKMEQLSITDTLTKLNNRYKIEDILKDEISRAKRYERCFGLLMLDIDYFKDVNDKYGHIQGDKVLKEFATILNTQARETDYIGRWGGEEFLIVIPESSEDAVLKFANRLRSIIARHRFDVVGQITVSIGATVYDKFETIESLITKADDAMYISKNLGRNSVHISM